MCLTQMACAVQAVTSGCRRVGVQVLGALAYNPIVQGILFQANYFRDPTKVNSTVRLG